MNTLVHTVSVRPKSERPILPRWIAAPALLAALGSLLYAVVSQLV